MPLDDPTLALIARFVVHDADLQELHNARGRRAVTQAASPACQAAFGVSSAAASRLRASRQSTCRSWAASPR